MAPSSPQTGALIGSHSHSHKNLQKIKDDELEKELGKSKHCLQEILDIPINYLSLPYGEYSNKTIVLASKFYKKIGVSKPLLFKNKCLVGRLPIHNANLSKSEFIYSVLSGKNNFRYQAKCILIKFMKSFLTNESYRFIKNRFSRIYSKNFF